MKIFKEIFARIWAFWGMLTFVITMLICLIPVLLFSYTATDPKKTIRFARYARVWINTYFFLIACPLTIRGKENFKKGENYIVVCNHNSLMDVPISYPAIPGGNKTIAKIEMARTPLFGIVYRIGSILVDRKSEASRRQSFVQMKQVLKMGLNMCIYPEGTRNKTKQPLKSFHSGAFRLAIETGKSIIPGIIFNTKKVLPPNKPFYLMPNKLKIHFLSPINIGSDDTIENLQQKVFNIMWEYYVNNQ